MEFSIKEDVACVNFASGKMNVVNDELFDFLQESLKRAARETKAVVLTGGDKVFSAGFDLSVMQSGPQAAQKLAGRGFELFVDMFAHPQPLVAACAGHAIGAGAFFLLCSDYRIGATGDYKVQLPETAIGMVMPRVLHLIAENRIASPYLRRALLQSEVLGPEDAKVAGFLDRLVPDQLEATAIQKAQELAKLPRDTFRANKAAHTNPLEELMRSNMGFDSAL